jgi:hypothetical protein
MYVARENFDYRLHDERLKNDQRHMCLLFEAILTKLFESDQGARTLLHGRGAKYGVKDD